MLSPPHPWPDSAAPSGLLPWLLPWPSYDSNTSLATVAVALAETMSAPMQRPWPSHIIVVDAQQRPQGALALGLLWAAQQSPPEQAPPPHLRDYLPWIEPVTILAAATPPTELRGLIAPLSPPCWVAVDEAGQYLGVVNMSAMAVQGFLNPPALASMTEPLATASAQEQRWVMAMSHALKTPLTSLLGLSTLLLDHRVGPLNDRQSRYAGLMRRAIRKLIRLVNQLVDWMRLESEQLDLDMAPVDLQALTETLLPTFLTSWLPDAAIPPAWMATFRYHWPADALSLRADSLRLQQSLYGVLGYLLHRGATPQSLTLEPWGPWLGLTVRATSAATEPPVSPPWTPALGAEIDGMETLGLALARRLCQRQGGDLVGFCSPLDGYVLTLLLPRIPREHGRQDASGAAPRDDGNSPTGSLSAPPDQAGEGRLVLLVSLNADRLVYLQRKLRPGPDRLLLATAWADAVDLVQRLTPTLVLVDAAGPELLGLPADPAEALAPFRPQTTAKLITEAHLDALALALDSPLAAAAPSDPPAPLTLLILTYLGQFAVADRRAMLGTPWQSALQRQRCRLVQADDLPQARLLCRVWQPQAIVLVEGRGFTPEDWEWVTQAPELMQRPWIRLTTLTTAHPPGLQLIDGAEILTQPIPTGVANLIQMIWER